MIRTLSKSRLDNETAEGHFADVPPRICRSAAWLGRSIELPSHLNLGRESSRQLKIEFVKNEFGPRTTFRVQMTFRGDSVVCRVRNKL